MIGVNGVDTAEVGIPRSGKGRQKPAMPENPGCVFMTMHELDQLNFESWSTFLSKYSPSSNQ